MKDDKKIPTGEQYRELILKAIHMIMLGFLYKYIIAHLIQFYAINPLMMDLHGLRINGCICMRIVSICSLTLLVTVYCGSISYIYGIMTPPNFKQPFKAKI